MNRSEREESHLPFIYRKMEWKLNYALRKTMCTQQQFNILLLPVNCALRPFRLTSSSLVALMGICHMWFKHIPESIVKPANTSTDLKKRFALQSTQMAWHFILFCFILVHSFSTWMSMCSAILHSSHFEILLGKSGHLNVKLIRGNRV